MIETIAAAATARGPAGLAVIRISGPKTRQICDSIFRSGKKPVNHPRHIILGEVRDPESQEILDQAMAVFFAMPHSYTGEDVLELSVHGSPAVTEAVLSLIFRQGAISALPGEFTRRAFQNGKIDLSQAEAVALLTTAESEQQRRIAQKMLTRGLSQPVETIRQLLLEILSGIELDLDFPEENAVIPMEQTIKKFNQVISALQNLLDAGRRGYDSMQRYQIVLTGKVNAGKSRLFNTLIGRNRAIVTEEPGTTRDTIESQMDIGGITITIIDTAGHRPTTSRAESEGINRSQKMIRSADLILLVLDGVTPDMTLNADLTQSAPQTPILPVWNKIDIAGPPPLEITTQIQQQLQTESLFPVSAKTGAGIADLRKKIHDCVQSSRLSDTHTALLLSFRQQRLLEASRDSIINACEILCSQTPPECAVPDIRSAYANLAEITGDNLPPDVLQSIFSHFCIGK